MATTQDNRLLSIATPLGKDFMLLNKLTAHEGISKLFSLEVELLHAEEDIGYTPTQVNIQQILGQNVTITIDHRDDTKREFNGIVKQFSQGTRHARFTFYYATIVPAVWVLTQNHQSRIFQQKSVPDILKEVFKQFDIGYEIQGTFEPRNYCVQYRESDFDFAARLMEEEGIFYYFKHADGKHKMILANTPQSHPDCPSKSDIPYFVDVSRGQEDFIGSIHSFHTDYQLRTGKVTLWDHNFELPNKKLESDKQSWYNVGQNQKLEYYDFPGGYARKFDGINKSGGEQTSELQKIFEDNRKTTELRMQAIDAEHKTISGSGDCCSLSAGYRFNLIRHPEASLNAQYVVTSITHEAIQNPTYVSDEESDQPYSNSFSCLEYRVPFRPPLITPKPVVSGSQTAMVVGPAGEEIFTDKYGRVKVQFHWDRHGRANTESSCWMRVAQSWAGKKWGTMFIPRIGMEVIVDFLEGNPDQPIITGCVYNPEAMPPYTLPDEKTKSTIKSNSSKGGGGFNEFRIEDKKGSEQIFIHAEKNEDIRVKNDAMETIGNDRHLIVGKDQLEKVKGDKHLEVVGDQNEKIGGSVSLKVGMDIDEKTGMNYALEAGMGIHIKSGMTLTIETGTNLTLKVGGNFININPAGVFIKGTMVMINSGGAAGSGSGSNPEMPKPPKEADTANPGEKNAPVPAPPPAPAMSYSPPAAALQNASKSGAPFVGM